MMAFQSVPLEGKGLIRFVVEKSTVAQKVLDLETRGYKEARLLKRGFYITPANWREQLRNSAKLA